MEATTVAYLAAAISGLSVVYLMAKDIFGAGNSLASKFASYERAAELKFASIDNRLMQMRLDFQHDISEQVKQSRIGLEAITANIHQLREGLLEFRAKMAEDYMRRDSYYKAADEVKKDFKERNDELRKDMHENFDRIEKQLDDMTQAIEANRRDTKTGK